LLLEEKWIKGEGILLSKYGLEVVPQDVAKLHAEAFPLAKCRATKDVPSRLKFMKMMKD
jgi:hypothetical protein